MEAAHFRSFYHFEPDIQSDHHLEPDIQFKRDVQSGVITHDDKPDFLIRVENKIIGVEITRLFISSAAAALESTQEGIFDEACRRAEGLKNLPPIDVTLFFNLRKPLRIADRSRIADAVVKVVADSIPADGGKAELKHQPGQPSEVNLIQINPPPPHRPEQGRWRADFAFSKIERNTFTIVQKEITKKAKLLHTYLKACNECWLLLVADSFKVSQNLEFSEDGQTHTFSSPFTRTYVLDFGRGRRHRLKTEDASPSRPPQNIGRDYG